MTEEASSPVTVVVENVTGIRIIAALIDIVVLFVLFLLMAALFGDTNTDEGQAGFQVSLEGGPFIVYLLLDLAYYFALEAFWGGQTLGKRVMGIKIVALDGALTPGKVGVRTLLRIVDALPIFYLLGLIVIATSQRKQRVGDMAAGTVVVRA